MLCVVERVLRARFYKLFNQYKTIILTENKAVRRTVIF